ncbi:hypothetical protein T492DRAFT_1134050 [Pavlovales sp. CCMP2436]|nr:hypothetical protein T492DRAFT_1134050 [Pavlovales sp. CCMP2436]
MTGIDRTDSIQFDLAPGISLKPSEYVYVRLESASIPIVQCNVNSSNNKLVLFYGASLTLTATIPVGNYTSGTDLAVAMNTISRSNPSLAGCICVLGDTKLLEDETTTDLKTSTYTMNHLLSEDVVSATTYQVTVLRYIPGQTQQRVFSWSSMDTPTIVVAKWKATVTPAVASHHSFIASADYGTFNNGIYYEVDRYSGSNASKNNLGQNVSTIINPFWNLNMPARPFPNVAQRAYIRSGIVVDASKRTTVEALGRSQRTNVRQIKYDITRFVDEQNIATIPYDPTLRFTLIVANSNLIFYAGGRAQNDDPYNIVDTLQTPLNFDQLVSMVIVNATVDSWLVTTDNIFGPMQVIVTPVFDPTVVAGIATKARPAFTSFTMVASTSKWQIANGCWWFDACGMNPFWKQRYSSFSNVQSFAGPDWTFSGEVKTFAVTVAHPKYSIWRLTVTKVQPDTTEYAMIVDMKLYTGCQHAKHASRLDDQYYSHEEWKSGEYWSLQICFTRDCHKAQLKKQTTNTMSTNNNKFKQDSTNLARASYLPLAEAAKYGDTLGYKLDAELSRPNTMVFIDRSSGQPVIVHRGSVTAKDWSHTITCQCGKIAQSGKSSVNNGESMWTLAGVISDSFRACFNSCFWHFCVSRIWGVSVIKVVAVREVAVFKATRASFGVYLEIFTILGKRILSYIKGRRPSGRGGALHPASGLLSDFVAAHPGVGLLICRLVCGGIKQDDAWAKDWFWRFHSYAMGSAEEARFDPFEERVEMPQGSLFVEVVADSLLGECEARRERSEGPDRKEFLQALWQLLLEFDKIHDYDDQADRVSNGNCDDVCKETFEGCFYD